MQTWRHALMEIPEAQRLETALFWLEEMTGGEQAMVVLQRAYGLTGQIAQIVAALSFAAPRMMTRTALYRVLYPNEDDVDIKVIAILISRARRALPAGAIVTVWGTGYQMTAPLPPLEGLRRVAPHFLPPRKSLGPGQTEARI